MSVSLNSLYGRPLRSWLLLLASIGLINLVIGCKGPLSLLPTPKVAANVQVAKVATQTVGETMITGDQKVETNSGHMIQIQEQQSKLTAESVDTVTINETSFGMIILLLLGWLLPTPNQIAKSILGVFKRWRKIPD